MKKLLLIVAVALSLAGCMPKLGHNVYFLDYNQAGKGKVYISEAPTADFDFTPLGSITVIEKQGYVTVSSETETENYVDIQDDINPNKTRKVKKKWQQPTVQGALDYAAQVAIERGGDGIINLHTDYTNAGSAVVSGMIIKRK